MHPRVEIPWAFGRWLAPLAASAVLLLTAACAGGPVLLPLPEPMLDRFEPKVREELTAAREQVRALTAEGGADRAALGRAHGQLGRLYHAYEQFDAAATCYRNAVTLLPEERAWSYYLGYALQSLHELDEALFAFERAQQLAPLDPAIRLALGNLHRELGHPDEARRLADEALAQDPRSPGALLLAAKLAVDRGDHSAAIRFYESLLELQPGATRLHQPLAIAWREQGDLERARLHLAQMGDGQLELDDPLLREMRSLAGGANRAVENGFAAYRAGDYAGAAAAFRQAVEADPTLVVARVNLGSALSRLARYDEAAEQFHQVVQLEPGHLLARFNLGVIAAKQGRTDESLRYYEEALALDASYGDARYNLANALRSGGRCDEALPHYRRLVENDPGHAPARVGELLCLLAEEQGPLVRQRLDEALVALPDHAGVLDAAARILAAAKDPRVRDGARALELAERLAGASRTPAYSETLAMALAEVGRFDEAATAMRQAITEAETGGRTARLPAMRANLQGFERREPCRDVGF